MDFLGPIMGILPTPWNCTSNRIDIIRQLEENLNSLREERRKLQVIGQDVRSTVERAKQLYRKPINQVEGWLKRERRKLEEVQNILEKGEQEIQKKCLGSCCPRNCYSSYKLGKEVIKETEAVKDLINEGKEFKSLDNVSEKLPPPPVDEISVKKTVGMESILNEVWSCLDDHEVSVIGIYGIGGVGKTTLLQKLNNKFINERRDFDVVIWVTVSKEVNLDEIQEVIRYKLDIPDEIWKSKIDKHGRAAEICRSLSRKKFLLLLDDLWERIDLPDMGVPDLSCHQNGSKIVFTTRSEDVCHGMDAAVKKFEVKCLSFDESFELFRQYVTDDVLNSHHQITEFAETVAQECKGLPLALITIGRAMSNRRTPEEWRYAINTLQSYPSEFADMESSVFQVLKFSYDSLRDDKHKNCFLFCSLFPEDHMIRKDELIDLWIAEGILHNNGLNDTRDAGEFIIRSLKHACLLEKVGDSDDYVKMHDVLRDMALWLASIKENKIFVFENQESIKKHGIATWKEGVRISLWGRSIILFTETPFCPRLLTFLVKQTEVETFPSSTFQSMHAMKVLNLSKNFLLTRLPAMLEMINLQYLNLADTNIQELPIVASSLTKLRFLLLDGTTNLKAISGGVISSLSSLQVFSRIPTKNSPLHFHSFWNTALLQELECLEDIEEISVTLFTVDAVLQLKSSPKLQRCVKRLVILCEQGKELHLAETSSSVLSTGCFDNLHDLYIKNCLIKDLTCLRYATRLRYVFAENCPLLVEIIANEFSSPLEDPNMFRNLKQLNFRDLPVLKSMCRVMHFPSLERIWVVRCPSLTKLPLDVFNENNSRISIVGEKEWWDKLEWENSNSKVSYPSMHQTAPVSGLAAQSSSYNFPHFTVADWYSDVPSYTYEVTKFEKKRNTMDSILDDVWRCLNDHTVRTIGIYGTGGVGKTTVLRKIEKKFINKRLGFDVMIWFTVDVHVDLYRIQEAIRKNLQIPGETWKTKTDEHSRAEEICRSLSGKKFLLLVDGLWEPIDLQNVGIPDLSSNQNGSKIVIATRSVDVCDRMDAAVKKIEVKCLSFEESFEMFRQCVKEDVLNSHPEIPELAKTIAKCCQGLPLALLCIGGAMSSRRKPEEWRHAINQIFNSRNLQQQPIQLDEHLTEDIMRTE